MAHFNEYLDLLELSPLVYHFLHNGKKQLYKKGEFFCRADERFIPIIEYAAQNGSVTNSDVQRILNTNRTTAYRLLQQMETWLEMQGITGKNTYYTIKGLPNASQTLQK